MTIAQTEDYDFIFLIIGGKGALTAAHRRKSAVAFRTVRNQYPTAKIAFGLDGYDGDPREIYEIPEARRYIRHWAEDAGLSDWRDAIQIPWDETLGSLAMLQMCGAFAEDSPIKVQLTVKH